MKRLLFFLLLIFGMLHAPSLKAQPGGTGTSFKSDFDQERKDLGDCFHFNIQHINRCGTLFTGKPLHLGGIL